MKKMMDLLAEEMSAAFEKAGYDASLGKVTVSNRPDLCEYQCNGAMAGAKTYHKAPLMIAEDVVKHLTDSSVFSVAEAVKPGFINLKVRESFISHYLEQMTCRILLEWRKQRILRRLSLIMADQMWQNLSMWGICALRLSERASNVWEDLWGIK